MSERTEELKARVRETPLIERLNLYKETGDDRVLIPIERTITPHDQEAG